MTLRACGTASLGFANAGYAPTRAAVYDDPELRRRYGYLA